MMIDDHEVGFLRAPPRRDYVTTGEIAAALTETVVARRGDLRPHRMCIRQLRYLGEITTRRNPRPLLDAREHRVAPRDALERALRPLAREAIGTKIIGTTFEERDADRRTECAGDERYVFGEQLVLQRTSPGRHQHA